MLQLIAMRGDGHFMTLTKKKLALILFALVMIYFVLLLFLPESIVGRRGEDLAFFLMKLGFLALTAAIFTVFILLFFFKGEYITNQINTFGRYKYYLRLLIKRDFITKYRKSVLGVVWSVLHPLLMMIVMTFAFQQLFRVEIENFPVYVFSGQLIFNFFSESTTLAMNSVIVGEGVIKKIYVPKYMFPLSRVISSLVNLLFSFVTFLLVFTFTGAQFYWTMLLVPIPFIFIFVFSLGIAMLLASLAVFFRDLTYLYGVLMQLLFFMTPIMYPVDIIPQWLIPFYGLNPLYHFVTYFRALTRLGTVPDIWSTMVCIGFALCALCVGTAVFMKQQDKYILNL